MLRKELTVRSNRAGRRHEVMVRVTSGGSADAAPARAVISRTSEAG